MPEPVALSDAIRPDRTTDRVADPGLITRAATGDVDAFDALLRPRLPRLFRMAVAITRNEVDARDAVQDASVSAWRQIARLRSPDRFDSWLDQILVNQCRSLLRRTRRVQVREIDIAGDPAGSTSHELTGSAATFADPTAAGPDLSESDLIRRAFARLDGATRSLLILHYVEERPIAEIARVMGSPVGTIKWRLSNARKSLDRALGEEGR